MSITELTLTSFTMWVIAPLFFMIFAAIAAITHLCALFIETLLIPLSVSKKIVRFLLSVDCINALNVIFRNNNQIIKLLRRLFNPRIQNSRRRRRDTNIKQEKPRPPTVSEYLKPRSCRRVQFDSKRDELIIIAAAAEPSSIISKHNNRRRSRNRSIPGQDSQKKIMMISSLKESSRLAQIFQNCALNNVPPPLYVCKSHPPPFEERELTYKISTGWTCLAVEAVCALAPCAFSPRKLMVRSLRTGLKVYAKMHGKLYADSDPINGSYTMPIIELI